MAHHQEELLPVKLMSVLLHNAPIVIPAKAQGEGHPAILLTKIRRKDPQAMLPAKRPEAGLLVLLPAGLRGKGLPAMLPAKRPEAGLPVLLPVRLLEKGLLRALLPREKIPVGLLQAVRPPLHELLPLRQEAAEPPLCGKSAKGF